MVADNSVDVVLSNCVLNLVDPEDRRQMIQEIHRVLKPGGRAVISDIVSDEVVPQHMKDDPDLWSGCISGSFVENEFVEVFEENGFYGVEILTRQTEPWVTVEGIEFRSMTVRAYKLVDAPCIDYGHAVLYNGPFKVVIDDEDHVITRGDRGCSLQKKTLSVTRPADTPSISRQYHQRLNERMLKPFHLAARDGELRDPQDTKMGLKPETTSNSSKSTSLPISDCCGSDSGCC